MYINSVTLTLVGVRLVHNMPNKYYLLWLYNNKVLLANNHYTTLLCVQIYMNHWFCFYILTYNYVDCNLVGSYKKIVKSHNVSLK